jgi:mutator protein MutT
MDPIRVTAAVVCERDRFLICQRPPNKRHGGLWEFPGGKCEPGETDFAATRRELHEELDVEVVGVGSPLYEFRDPGSDYLIAFVPVCISGKPVLIEHIAIEWATVDELLALPLAPSDRVFVETCLVPE